MTLPNIGKELRKLRVDLGGMTLFDMANAIGMSTGMLSSVETGRKPAPTDLIKRLAAAFPEVEARRDEFEELAMQTRSELKVRLSEERHNLNELAAAFAKRFDDFSDSEISSMMALIKPHS